LGLLSRFQASPSPQNKAFTRTVEQTVHETSLKNDGSPMVRRPGKSRLVPAAYQGGTGTRRKGTLHCNPRAPNQALDLRTVEALLFLERTSDHQHIQPIFLHNLFRSPAYHSDHPKNCLPLAHIERRVSLRECRFAHSGGLGCFSKKLSGDCASLRLKALGNSNSAGLGKRESGIRAGRSCSAGLLGQPSSVNRLSGSFGTGIT
jgi:hypothetical protein